MCLRDFSNCTRVITSSFKSQQRCREKLLVPQVKAALQGNCTDPSFLGCTADMVLALMSQPALTSSLRQISCATWLTSTNLRGILKGNAILMKDCYDCRSPTHALTHMVVLAVHLSSTLHLSGVFARCLTRLSQVWLTLAGLWL